MSLTEAKLELSLSTCTNQDYMPRSNYFEINSFKKLIYNAALIPPICMYSSNFFRSQIKIHFCPQSVFILAEKAWAGSNLLYKWQKTLGNYIAVAG